MKFPTAQKFIFFGHIFDSRFCVGRRRAGAAARARRPAHARRGGAHAHVDKRKNFRRDTAPVSVRGPHPRRRGARFAGARHGAARV
jgi:hypothetical protein